MLRRAPLAGRRRPGRAARSLGPPFPPGVALPAHSRASASRPCSREFRGRATDRRALPARAGGLGLRHLKRSRLRSSAWAGRSWSTARPARARRICTRDAGHLSRSASPRRAGRRRARDAGRNPAALAGQARADPRPPRPVSGEGAPLQAPQRLAFRAGAPRPEPLSSKTTRRRLAKDRHGGGKRRLPLRRIMLFRLRAGRTQRRAPRDSHGGGAGPRRAPARSCFGVALPQAAEISAPPPRGWLHVRHWSSRCGPARRLPRLIGPIPPAPLPGGGGGRGEKPRGPPATAGSRNRG